MHGRRNRKGRRSAWWYCAAERQINAGAGKVSLDFAKDVVNFFEFDGMGGSIAITHNWNRLRCEPKVDVEGVPEEML
jgi:hypothetical protein